MWWEILPSFGIITAVMAIPSLAQRAINRAIHEGNPTKRDYTMTEKYAVLYHWRDMQHSRPNVWNKYVKVSSIPSFQKQSLLVSLLFN